MFAAMTWCLLDYRLAKKWSLVGWCSGTISGLVAATPASGVITPWASVLLGVVTGVACNFGTKIKFWMRIDDALDVFAEHAIGGIVGLIFNGFFAADYIISLDGINTGGGFLNHNYKQLYIQVAYVVAAIAYSFVVSAIIAKAIDMIPGLHLRASTEAELLGMDDDQHGEFAYDYVEVRRDYLAWTPAEKEQREDGAVVIPQHGIEGHQDMVNSTRVSAPPTPPSEPPTKEEKVTGSSD
jgi:Amt family ammonium transporter